MKSTYTESENSAEIDALITEVCGRDSNRGYDEFGIDDSWLEEFIEDYKIA
jgi:hypothetical protein